MKIRSVGMYVGWVLFHQVFLIVLIMLSVFSFFNISICFVSLMLSYMRFCIIFCIYIYI